MAETNVELKKYNEASGQFDTMLPRPMKHASTHSQFGDDPITPEAIGALPAKAKAESAKVADDVVGISASKITSGVLPVNKGGTGVTTIEALKKKLNIVSLYYSSNVNVVLTDDNIYRVTIPLNKSVSYIDLDYVHGENYESYLPKRIVSSNTPGYSGGTLIGRFTFYNNRAYAKLYDGNLLVWGETYSAGGRLPTQTLIFSVLGYGV